MSRNYNLDIEKIFIEPKFLFFHVMIISTLYGEPRPTVCTVNLLCFQPVFCMQSLDPPDSCLTLIVVPVAAY